ncbi:MAG: hypothetical protein U0T07_09585 [Chitinophagales bacterium]
MKKIIFVCLFIFLIINIFSQNSNASTQYKKHTPCTFSVSLPIQFKLINEYPGDNNPDICDYLVKTKSGLSLIKLSSLIMSRFEFITIKDFYKEAINKSDLNIVYKIQKANWFVISGTKKNNGNIVYWKRVVSANFVSDLYIEYTQSQKKEIEPFLSKISTSFTSQ